MKDTTLLIAGMATLSAGTLAFRLSGPLLRKRLTFPPWAENLLEAAAVILLAALVATTALTQGHAFVGPAIAEHPSNLPAPLRGLPEAGQQFGYLIVADGPGHDVDGWCLHRLALARVTNLRHPSAAFTG